MEDVHIVVESTPINVSHDTYKRECRYTRGIHIPINDLYEILESMPNDIRMYFEFHNPGKELIPGTFLNGYSGFAKSIADYYQHKNSSLVPLINNGKDFYVKII